MRACVCACDLLFSQIFQSIIFLELPPSLQHTHTNTHTHTRTHTEQCDGADGSHTRFFPSPLRTEPSLQPSRNTLSRCPCVSDQCSPPPNGPQVDETHHSRCSEPFQGVQNRARVFRTVPGCPAAGGGQDTSASEGLGRTHPEPLLPGAPREAFTSVGNHSSYRGVLKEPRNRDDF